jgi:uncharacterized protein (TIGR03435 family)
MNSQMDIRRRRIAPLFTAATALLSVSIAASPQRDTPAEGRAAFEAATVKLAAPDAVRNRAIQTSPDRLSIPSMTLTALVYAAYGGGGFNTWMRVTGGPDWANTTAYAIDAVASGPATPRQMRLMLQTLLAERFALMLGDASEDVPMGGVLALTVDRPDGTLGPKVRKWDGTCPSVVPAMVFPAPRRPLLQVDGKFLVGPASDADDTDVPYCPTGYRAGGITVDGATMATVAEMLSLPPSRALLGTVTVDRTGLTGRYTLELEYLFGASPPTAPPEFGSPSLSTAIREQWGLRVVPSTGRLKVIVIESAQRPAAN